MKTGFALLASLILLGTLPVAAQEMKPFENFRDCEGCPEMVVIPTGTFMMGGTEQDGKVPFVEFNVPNELPRHEVQIAYSFGVGKFEVTVDEFARYVSDTGAQTGGLCAIRLMEQGPNAQKFIGTRDPVTDEEVRGPYLVFISDGSFDQPGLAVSGKQPAVCISRLEAKGYLAWLSEQSGRNYRLLSEAEWEYVTRAGTETVAFWGNDLTKACEYANFGDRKSGYQAGYAAPCSDDFQSEWSAEVGRYKPNPWGLYDTLGNVQEMLEDCWFDDYQGAPADGSPRMEGEPCEWFMARGGDYELLHVSMRSAERLFYGDENGRSNVMGFRVAVSLSDNAWDRK